MVAQVPLVRASTITRRISLVVAVVRIALVRMIAAALPALSPRLSRALAAATSSFRHR